MTRRRGSPSVLAARPRTVSTDVSTFAAVFIGPEDARFAVAECELFGELETGGMLIGYREGKDLHLTQVTPPGPRAEHRGTSFRRDGAFSQALLDAAVRDSAGRDDYVGEWHSHPFDQGPSGTDLASLRRIASNPKYACPHPLLLLARLTGDAWRLEAYQWDGRRLVRVPLVDRPAGPAPDGHV